MVLLHYQPPTKPYLKILFQDEDILVLEKPSGLLSVRGRAPQHFDSLQTRVQTVYPTASVVHRLDMATSGIMLMALSKDVNSNLSRQFQQRDVDKTYIARVYGTHIPDSGSVDLPLICDWPNRPKQKVDHEQGKPSLTHYHCLHRDQYSALMELKPVTGRSHQLRVHMQAIGHPILGDRLYANEPALAASERLLLHAHSISFNHPTTGQRIAFESNHGFNTEPNAEIKHEHQTFIKVHYADSSTK